MRDAIWLAWLALALLAGILELTSGDFVLLMIAGGAVVAAGSAGLELPIGLQAVIFALSSALLVFAVRPPLKRMLARSTPHTVTGAAALPGQRAETITEVSDRAGTVKLAGEVWTARATDPGIVIEPGATVEVVAIEGATAMVRVPGDGPRELYREPPASR